MPQRLGRYVVRRRIGSGGFATVWLAYDEELDSPVAVKVLADNWTEDSHIRRRFQEEGRYLRKVESPHVVSVYDAGVLDDGRPYLVMSYADQGTLADRLEVEGLTATQALEVVRQVGSGLQALHDRDVLHRDVKPANVLFRSVQGAGGQTEVRAMLGDLGLGKALDVSSRLTMVAGTPSYVAPEQAQAEDLDARADQYSLAALTYLLLTGRQPFTHRNLEAAATPPDCPPLSTPERPFGPAVEAVVRRGLARDREDRFPSVSAFVAALESALSTRSPSGDAAPWLPVDPDLTQPGARPSPSPAAAETVPAAGPAPRRGRVLVPVLAGLLALVVGGGAGYAAHARTDPDVVVSDGTRQLQVTVPTGWDRARSTGEWTPPAAGEDEGGDATLPALSVGTSSTWATDDGEGAFLALLAGTELPDEVPGHPECARADSPSRDDVDGQASITGVFTGCPGGSTTVERVVQVASNRLLWVQIRSDERGTATDVLASVTTRGL